MISQCDRGEPDTLPLDPASQAKDGKGAISCTCATSSAALKTVKSF